jgi:formylglycine-generating enzyme required for sulfatase activity
VAKPVAKSVAKDDCKCPPVVKKKPKPKPKPAPAPVAAKPKPKPKQNCCKPAAAPEPAAGEVWVDPFTGMEFVWVPGGAFDMGCRPPAADTHIDQGKVRVAGFWIGRYEVTQAQWQKVMEENPSFFKKGDRYPVDQVSLPMAKAFAARLGGKGQFKFRLPTEAEWEYAARSGGRPEQFAGGSDPDLVAWYGFRGGDSTQPVGAKAPNGLGLYDMSGNVQEWCEDDFAFYAADPQDNPNVRTGSGVKVVRGGGWSSKRERVRTAYREPFPGASRLDTIGFRLVLVHD